MCAQLKNNAPLDLIETAQKMIDAAVAVTTGRLHLSSPAEARSRLAEGDPPAVSFFRHDLVRQIASALLMMDPHVIAVFEDQDVPVERDVVVAEVDLTGPLRFVVQVEHRTAALNMVIEALDQALRQAFTDILPEPPRRLIEAIVVDNRDSRLLDVRMDGFRSLPKLLTHRS